MFSFLVLFVRTVFMTNLVSGARSGLRRIVCWRLSLEKGGGCCVLRDDSTDHGG